MKQNDKKRRAVKVSFRLTEGDALKLESLMALMGYRNRSLFIRDMLIGSRVKRRNLSRTDANPSRQVEQLKAEIRRIGVNYNQVVKAVNTLSRLRDKRGNAVVTASAMDGSLTDMKLLMENILDRVILIGNEVSGQDDMPNQ